MDKKIKISIGIPAYEEEKNIGNLLESILKQHEKGFIIIEVIVVIDASTDGTLIKVKSINDKRIRIIKNKERIGQGLSQNKIIKSFLGDILVLLNADILPTSNTFLSRLIEPVVNDSSVVLTSPRVIYSLPNNFFEKIINFSVDYKESMLNEWKKGDNVLHCHGSARAFRRDFAKNIRWKTSVGEDAYTYLLCISSNLKFKFQSLASVYNKSPDNFMDHKRQSARFMESKKIMKKYFNQKKVEDEYKIPLKLKISKTILYFFLNPLLFTSYIFIFVFIFFGNKKNYSNSLWEVSRSSKKLLKL